MFARILFVVVAVTSFVADRVTKLLVQQQMEVGDRISVIGDLFELRYVQNRGIAFGLFSDAGMLVVVGKLIVGAMLFFFMLHVEPEDLLTIGGGALITGGALGNLVDRVQYRYVVDFLHLPNWPTFNVADISITLGVAAILIAQLAAYRAELREAREADPEEQQQ